MPDHNDAARLRRELEQAEADLKSKRHQLEVIENTCRHEWGPTKYESVVTMPAHEEGDAPGTMGVDYIRRHWVPEQRRDEWTRTCKKCGKKERTSETEEHVSRTPKFRS